MSVVMPIYTVAILVFFIYTIVKILFKNKDKDKEEEEDDEEFLNSEYYKNHLAQQKAAQEKSAAKKLKEEGKELSEDTSVLKEGRDQAEQKKPEKNNVVRFKLDEEEEKLSKEEKPDDSITNTTIEEVTTKTPATSEKTPPEVDPSKELILNMFSRHYLFVGDIEIQLLRAKLEQTEKTLEAVLAQMASISMPSLRVAKKVRTVLSRHKT